MTINLDDVLSEFLSDTEVRAAYEEEKKILNAEIAEYEREKRQVISVPAAKNISA
jgi:hypothetical protein